MKHAKTLKWLLTLACLLAALCAFTLAANAKIVDSGYCGAKGDGSNLSWTLDDAGILTISGEGGMESHSYSNETVSWFSYLEQIQKIIIENGVTSIGDRVFSDCHMSSISIPSSVISIGYRSFESCLNLSEIYIPNSVTSIGESAFQDSGLTKIELPNSITTIKTDVFAGCRNLSSVAIPESVVSIESQAFAFCPNLKGIVIPNSVTSIGYGAFAECTGLIEITLPNSINSIGEAAFIDCTSLVSIILPDSVTFVGRFAFSGCTNLKFVSILARIKSIYDSTFAQCLSLWNIIIPESIQSVSYGAFADCNSLQNVYYCGSKGQWNKISFDILNEPLFSATIYYNFSVNSADSQKIKCGDNAFWKFDKKNGLLTISGSGDMWDYGICGPWYDLFDDIKCINIEEGITSIGGRAFAHLSRTEELNLPSSLISIGENAFEHCWNLSKITLFNSIKTIGKNAFLDCINLTNIYYYGSQYQWKNILIDLPNDPLLTAKIHCKLNDISGVLNNYSTTKTADGSESVVTEIVIDSAIYQVKEGIIIPPIAEIYKNNEVNAACFDNVIESIELISNNKKDFLLGRDNNSFVHMGRNFFPGYVERKKTYRDAIDQVYIAKLKKNGCLGNSEEDLDRKWNGACFGIAMTMGLLYEDRIMISDLSKQKSVEDYHSLPLPVNDRSFVSIINYYQLSQGTIINRDTLIAETYSKKFGRLDLVVEHPLKDFLKQLVERYIQNHVLLLGYAYDNLDEEGKRESSGHEVLITGITYNVEKNVFDVSIYDENIIDSNGDKGKFLTMTIASDYSSFSFVDANNKDVYNIYKEMDILDPAKVDEKLIFRNSGVRNASASEPQRCTIYVPFDKDFTLSNTEGELLTCKSGYFEGNMPIYTSYTIHNTESPYFVFETDRSDLFSLTEIQDGMEIRVFDSDDHFVSFEGNHLDQVNLGIDSGVELQGTEYDFKVYLSTDSQGNESDGLIAVSADADGKTEIAKNGSGLAVHSDHPLKNVETASYGDDEIKKENADICALTFSIDEDATISNDSAIVYGDVDGDGKISAADARLALRASVGLKEPGDVEKGSAAYLACDVDGDGKVTSADARLILRASVGLEDASKFGKKN